jgi:exodeoxyribonuclease VII small subunit
MPATSPQPDELSFEDAMERLEEIVSAMEGERMPLEDMVQSYAEGARLLKQCRSRIDTARQRVELITADLDGTARATLSTFDEATAEAAAESTAKPRSGNTRRSPAKPAPDDAGDDDIRLF